MDLAKYCVDAVLVEGRSVRAVAAATGRSKSWVQRHVALYHMVEVKGLEPSACTLRMSGSRRLDQVLSEALPGSGVSIPSGSLTFPPLPSR